MTIKQARKLRDILLISGFIVMLSAYIWEPLFIIGAVISCSCLIPHFLFNRCPHCGKQLGNHAGLYCQYCGKNLTSKEMQFKEDDK